MLVAAFRVSLIDIRIRSFFRSNLISSVRLLARLPVGSVVSLLILEEIREFIDLLVVNVSGHMFTTT